MKSFPEWVLLSLCHCSLEAPKHCQNTAVMGWRRPFSRPPWDRTPLHQNRHHGPRPPVSGLLFGSPSRRSIPTASIPETEPSAPRKHRRSMTVLSEMLFRSCFLLNYNMIIFVSKLVYTLTKRYFYESIYNNDLSYCQNFTQWYNMIEKRCRPLLPSVEPRHFNVCASENPSRTSVVSAYYFL